MNWSQKDKQKLFNKYGTTALITGASSGIGRAFAMRLAEAGFSLVLHGRDVHQLTELEKQIKHMYAVSVICINSDLSANEGIQTLMDKTAHISVNLFVASAGFGSGGLYLDSLIKNETEMIRVNIEALAILTHHYGNKMRLEKRGAIILMSSMVSFQPVPYAANYAATKAYVQSLAEALSIECKPYGIAVLASAPGPVNTGFAKRAGMKMSQTIAPDTVAIESLRALGKTNTVVPGLLGKLMAYSLRTLPRNIKVHILKNVMRGMTKQV